MSVIEPGSPRALKPWYRQFWPWFLIVPPLAAVIGGMFTLYLAVASPDPLVQRDHHQKLGPVVTEAQSRRKPQP